MGVYRWNAGASSYINLKTGQSFIPTDVAARVVGSLPVGASNYSYPADAMFVAPDGSDSDAGTIEAPKKTIAGARDAVTAGKTIVVRQGVYHEQFTSNKACTIQAYPQEEVWLDGSTVFSSWTGSSPWTAPLSTSWSPIDSSRYPYNDSTANLPEQVWIDGVAQKQIADGQAPSAGQFSVDRTTQTLSIGTDPAGKQVRVADLDYAIVFSAPTTVLGIGFRRYSPLVVEGISALIYFGGSSQESFLENCVFQESGMHGISTARKITLSKITVQDCMHSGIQATTANGFVLEDFVIRRNNRGLWNFQPITAGVKVTKSEDIIIRHGLVLDVPNGAGVWLDTYAPRHIIGNVHVNGATAFAGGTQMDVGIHPEGTDGGKFDGIQYRGWVVSCSVTGAKNAIKLLDSGWLTISNNKVENYSSVGVYLQQDDRRNDGSKPDEGTVEESPWLTLSNILQNNDIGQGGLQVIAYQDPISWTPAQLGWDSFEKMEGNWFRPAPPGSMVQLGTATGARTSFNSLESLELSDSSVGGPPGAKLGVNHQGTTEPADSIAAPLDVTVAGVLGVEPGVQKVGLLLPVPIAAF